MTAATIEAWPAAYSKLTRQRPGVLGDVVARGPAQVRRLAMIFALLDQTAAVDLAHLLAALEVWRFCEDSAAFTFGSGSGDSVQDKIAAELRTAAPQWLDRTALRDLFGRNLPSGRIDAALAALHAEGKVEPRKVSSGGRPTEEWRWVA